MIASRGVVGAAVGGQRRDGGVDAGAAAGRIGSRSPISPVEQTATSPAETPSAVGDLLGGGVGVLEALRAGAGVGAAGVEDDGVDPAVAQHLLAPDAPARP